MELLDTDACFVCGNKNANGLKLKYSIENRKFYAEFIPDERFQGFNGIVHGGIISALLDEAMVNLAFRLGLNAVSASLSIDLRKPAFVGQILHISGEIEREEGRKIYARSEIRNQKNETVAEAQGLLIKIK